MNRPLARDGERLARERATASRAVALSRFFKTGPGQYGEGDRFLGLTVPQVRALAAELRDMGVAEIDRLLRSPWHELRLLALVLLSARYRRSDPRERAAIYRRYLDRTRYINNWDLVDLSAPAIVGAHLVDRSRAPLYRLARSSNLWERRIAVVSTYAFIRRGECGETVRLAERLLEDRHDLIHKAVGWMLREVGKRDERALTRFLDRYAGAMPRTMLRYAIERLSPGMRRRYMKA